MGCFNKIIYKKPIDILYNIYYNFNKVNKKIKNDF